MDDEEIDRRLKSIFATVLAVPVDQIDESFSPVSCPKWDSLNQIHLVNGIEEEFGITLDFESQMNMMSYGSGLQIVKDAVSAKAS